MVSVLCFSNTATWSGVCGPLPAIVGAFVEVAVDKIDVCKCEVSEADAADVGAELVADFR